MPPPLKLSEDAVLRSYFTSIEAADARRDGSEAIRAAQQLVLHLKRAYQPQPAIPWRKRHPKLMAAMQTAWAPLGFVFSWLIARPLKLFAEVFLIRVLQFEWYSLRQREYWPRDLTERMRMEFRNRYREDSEPDGWYVPLPTPSTVAFLVLASIAMTVTLALTR